MGNSITELKERVETLEAVSDLHERSLAQVALALAELSGVQKVIDVAKAHANQLESDCIDRERTY